LYATPQQFAPFFIKNKAQVTILNGKTVVILSQSCFITTSIFISRSNFILLAETFVHKNQSTGILSLIRAEFFNICLMSAQVHPRPFAPPKKGLLRLHKQEITELLT
jgi:hypothetical protein